MRPRPPLPAPLHPDAAGRPSRLGREVEVPPGLVTRLVEVCEEVDDSPAGLVDAGRDWWPLSVQWAVEGILAAKPALVARPGDSRQVAAVLAACDAARVPVTAVGGRSGVCGASLPVFGGVALDLANLQGIVEVDSTSLLADARAGTFGDAFEESLRSGWSLTAGHWPQSIALSTVGGWAACRSAGQYSTRYGKIEDMVAGLEVALADGTLLRTGGRAPRSATGPDLTQLFVGSEGTLGVVTEVRMRVHPVPGAERRAAYAFAGTGRGAGFGAGLDACRRVLRRGATPAVLRLYDPAEAARTFDVEGASALVVLDEGDPGLVDAVMEVVDEECEHAGASALEAGLVGRWLEHRNHLPPLESLARGGIVADTIEVSAPWAALEKLYRGAVDAVMAIEGSIAASAHHSHSYLDGGCLYFTFAGRPPAGAAEPGDSPASKIGAAEAYYRAAWDAVMAATTRAGGALSHHHGIGLNRSRYMQGYLGPAFDVLAAVKAALDPHGILNPGKLGLPSPFGEVDAP
ncbi:MAG: FAD-binding oxidoreductase [Acidimicrobiales bacterium]